MGKWLLTTAFSVSSLTLATYAGAQPESGITAASNGRGLIFESSNGDYTYQVGGRLQFHSAFYDAGNNEFGDGSAIRRLFLDVRGTVYSDWTYRFQYDFARPSAGDSSARGIRDAWIEYSGLEGYRITIGNFKEPFGLEGLISSLSTTFIERAVTDVFSPDRRLGVGISTNGAGWTAAAGVFGESPEVDVEGEGNESNDVAGRVTFAPVNHGGRLLHLGIAGRLHTPNDSLNSLRFRARPESNITSVRLVDTGTISDVDQFASLGLEFAARAGSLSLQSEYIQTRIQRSGEMPSADLSAWYVYGSWLLTGDSRPYQEDTGVFGRISPVNPFGGGGPGAWELALRFSKADLSDGMIEGGEQDNLTLGANWYPRDNIRFSANYSRVLDVDRPSSIYHKQKFQGLTLGAQIDF